MSKTRPPDYPRRSDVSFRPVSPGRLGGKEKEPEPLPFGLLARVLENVPSEPAWAWKGYLAPGAITLLAGRPKVGKSTHLALRARRRTRGRPTVG
jgi:hypothetical protein